MTPIRPEQIRLIVSDIDGTLITGDHRLLPGTVETLERVVERGVIFATLSARSRPNTLEAFPDLARLCRANGFVNGSYVTGGDGQALARRRAIREHAVSWRTPASAVRG